MMNEMKKNELNEQEIENVAGGSSYIDHYIHVQQLDRENGIAEGSEEVGAAWKAVGDAASTAWAVIKHAFDVCG